MKELENNEFKVADKIVSCGHCGSTAFDNGVAQLNTPGMTMLGLDAINEAAISLICRTCGRVELFMPKELVELR